MQAVTTTADWSIWINFIEACYIDVGDVINDDWHFVLSPTFFFRTPMHRLNSGIRNRHNFFLWPIYLFQKVVTDSVNHADSGDIKVFVQFPGNSISKILQNFWKCVGGAYMRGCSILKITKNVSFITLDISICEIRGIYLTSP